MRLPKRITWQHVRRLYEALEPFLKAQPAKASQPDRGRVLVLAPHIDDEVIGCGGSLRKHVLAGDEVSVLYFADCAAERRKEAEEAAGILGIRDLGFLDFRSKTLLDNQGPAAGLAAAMAGHRPDIVYLPSLFDRHNDHMAVNHLLCRWYEKELRDITVCGCEIWTTFAPNLVVDISDTVETKRSALGCFRSQLSVRDWQDAAISLNRFRGITSNAGGYAEGFLRFRMKDYHAVWKKVYAG
ncbi:MAG: PIG-L family deacetylase [Nitrospiraceae bacterium]|nr:PIG-L family deacetylase [Nitrospiraceae bacterium]